MKQILLGLIRHALTAFGGGLVSSGDLSSADLEIAVGAALTLVGMAWSIYEKRREKAPAA